MNFIDLLKSRELLKQVNHEDELHEHLESPRVAYIGVDPTADSLHIGHLLAVLNMKRWQDCGHKAVLLMGGGTGLVGDPSGKTDMRKMLTEESINHNIERFKLQVANIVDLQDPSKAVVVNNADWLSKLSYIPFLRDFGKHFSVNRMLTAECFKSRLEKGLTFLEFNYMLLQAYDFYELFKTQNVTVQLGGDDQWSNMLAGADLIRRKEASPAFCLTVPLLTNSEGKKMGKTEKGSVWLDPDKTSPFDFFQYWRNVEDASVRDCFLYMTEVPVDEINDICNQQGAAINQAKVRLATEITKIVHGEEEALKAQKTAENLFAQGGAGAAGNVPEFELAASLFEDDTIGVVEMLTKTEILKSKSEVRRLIQQGGLTVGDSKVTDIAAKIESSRFADDGLLIKKGKKHYYRLRISK